MLDTYKIRENHENRPQNNNSENTETEYTINDQLLLEMIFVAIRGETIKYSSRRKKESIKQETQLEEDIKKIEHDISENLESTNSKKLISLNEKKKKKKKKKINYMK